MAGYYQMGHLGGRLPQVSGVTLVSASVTALAIGGPILGMMGFSFLASITLLVVCSPLLLLFSPLLLPVAFLFMVTLACFAVADAMALTGLHLLGGIARETKRGNLQKAVAHIITGVIGAGVLSLAWSVAELGWIGGPIMILVFASTTFVSVNLLSDCYRFPHPQYGNIRCSSLMDAVHVYLG
ncbi:hypothetical protein VNO80_05245 [Phaseolus coccineus]|uniref:Amino acid transporter transmembrane domain-containing protein n=1 Tax=Phaseolus coccineus TaxID=3886 RepID=A0AAN9NER6_PHACN